MRDSVVAQLLSKMDGVEKLENVLLIGLTNRRSLMDEALLRPGRFEVQVGASCWVSLSCAGVWQSALGGGGCGSGRR